MIYRISKLLISVLLVLTSETAFGVDVTPVGPPTAPTTVTARLANPGSTTNSDVIVEWSGGSNGGSPVTGYQVTPYIGNDYTTTASVSCSAPGPNISDSCTVSGLAFASKYKFKVTRNTAIGGATSDFSAEVSTGFQSQTVSISGTPSSYRFGDPDFQLSATASSGLAVEWSIPSTTEVCSVDISGTVRFLKSGTCTIRATQSGSGSSYASGFSEVTVTSSVTLSATLGSATSVQSSQATLNAIVAYPGVDVTPTFCLSTTNSNSSCSLPSGVSIGSYSPSTITATSSTNVTAVASGLSQNTTYYFWITVTGSGATPYSTTTGSFTTVSGPSLSYSGSRSGTVGTALNGTLTASSGSGVYASWSAASLPTGTSFSPGVTSTTSTLSGTPTAAGNYSALFTVTDSSGLETQLNVLFTIAAQPSTNNDSNNNSNNNSNNDSNNNSGSGSSGSSGGGSSGAGSSSSTTPQGPGAGTNDSTKTPTGTPTSAKNESQPVDLGSSSTDGGLGYLFRDSISELANLEIIESGRGLGFSAMDWSVAAYSTKSKLVQNQSGEPNARLSSEVAGKITITGTGFKPSTQVDIYGFSTPIWIAGVYVSKAGDFELTITLPRTLAIGEHILQVMGVGPAAQRQYANIPLLTIPKGSGDIYLPNSLISRTINGPVRTTILLKDVPVKTNVSWKGEVSDKTRGVKSASIKLRLLTITPDQNFSGVILLPIQTKLAGVTVARSVALTVLPLAPKSAQHAINGLNETVISWSKSSNATKYLVTLGDAKICETSSTSCVYEGLAGPNSRFEIKALGSDGTEAPVVRSKYLQTKQRLIATVNFSNNSSALDARAIENLQALIGILTQQGFTAINIIGYADSVGKKALNQKLSAARAKAVSDFISGNIVGAVNAIGKGKSKPLKSNATKDGRAANRRVEIYVY